ncbi:MAG: replication-relaxation family protein, partial [Chloroflexi bacterium]|nr:replication-relaxation family protein [Chloroflexota bacterium]
MPRGRPSIGLNLDQVTDFQHRLRAWMVEKRHTAATVAELIGYTAEYVRLLLGEYQEKHRPPSANVLGRLREIGFEWTPPPVPGGEEVVSGTAKKTRSSKQTAKRSRRRRTTLSLMERDQTIILFLARAELATREQLQNLVFPSAATATRRLRQLADAKVLRRYRPPSHAGGQLSGTSQYLYTLGPRGANIAAEALGHPVRQAFKTSRALNALFLEHRLEVTQFFIHIVQGAGDRLADWATGAALEDKVRSGGRQRRFAPDGYLALRLEDGSLRHALVEVDRGTMGRQAWLTKARAYQSYYRSGAYARRYSTDRLLVLVVVPDAERRAFIRGVMQAVRPVVMCFIATWPDVESHTATGPAW